MRQKSNSTPASSETLVSCSMACAGRPQSPSFADAKASPAAILLYPTSPTIA